MINLLEKKHRFVLIASLLFLLLRLPSLFEPYWYGDEGIYLVLGQALRKGLVLYRQIHDNKPPSLYYLAAIAQTVFGFRLLLAISMAFSSVIFHKFSTKLFSAKFAKISTILFIILTSIPLIEGNIANAEIFMVLPTLAGIYYFFYSKSTLHYLVSGLLLGLAFTFKVPVAVEFALLCAWVLAFNFERSKIKLIAISWFALVVGFVLPIVLFFALSIYQRAGNEFLFSALLQNFGYLSSWSTGSHSGSATSGGLVNRAVIMSISWLIIYFLYLKKHIPKSALFVFTWFCATVFGALLSTRPYPHYLIQLAPPLVLILTLIFSTLATLKQRIISIILLAGLGFYLVSYKFYYYPVVSYYKNFYAHIFSLNSVEYRNYFGARVDDTYQIAQFLKNTTAPEEDIFIWGDEPYIYALSDRLPVGKYTVAYHVADFNQYENTYNQLIVQFPKTVIYYPQPGRPFPDLDRFIKLYYSPATAFGEATIYTRNE
ncbi:hypothetical protein HYV64_00205 [Candidatus Shapirobacteria bacterium]|nr:hypothetical protein [Candidatus Shapirobacteria bacterium]